MLTKLRSITTGQALLSTMYYLAMGCALLFAAIPASAQTCSTDNPGGSVTLTYYGPVENVNVSVPLLVDPCYVLQHDRIAFPFDVVQNRPVSSPSTNGALARFEVAALSSYLSQRGMSDFAGMTQFEQGTISAPYSVRVNDIVRFVYEDRASARAAVYLALMNAIAKSPSQRTADEDAVITWAAAKVQARRVAIAQAALNEYQRWVQAGYCKYTAPAGFKAYNPGPACYSNLYSDIGGTPNIPPFREYGLAEVSNRMNTPNGAQTAQSAEIAVADLVAPLVAEQAGEALTLSGAITPLLTDILPFSILAVTVTKGENAATAALSEALAADAAEALPDFVGAAAGPFAAVVFAVEGIITETLAVVHFDNVGKSLQNSLTSAENTTVNLQPALTNKDAAQELYATFMETTLFMDPSGDVLADPADPNPAAAPTQPRWFVHAPVALAAPHQAPLMNYKTWDGSEWSAQMEGAWFYHTPLNGSGIIQSDVIHYVDWQGNQLAAQWMGDHFTVMNADGSNAHSSSYLLYVAPDGSFWTTYMADRSPYNVNTPPAAFADSVHGGKTLGTTQLLSVQNWQGWSQNWYAVQGVFVPAQSFALGQSVQNYPAALTYRSWDGTDWYLVVLPDHTLVNVNAGYTQVAPGKYVNLVNAQGVDMTYTIQ